MEGDNAVALGDAGHSGWGGACVGCKDDDKTVVCVYRKPRSEKRSNGKLFLRVDCIGWLLSYAAEELSCQGVEPTPEDE